MEMQQTTMIHNIVAILLRESRKQQPGAPRAPGTPVTAHWKWGWYYMAARDSAPMATTVSATITPESPSVAAVSKGR